MSIGEELRQAREQLGASLLDVENETKIRTKYIIAMEKDDFDVLPGKVYVKGFLRTYARFLGLNGEALISQYKEQLGPQLAEEQAYVAQQPIVRNSQLIGRWKGVAVAVLALILIILVYQGGAMLINSADNNMDNGEHQGSSPNHIVNNQDQVPDLNKSNVDSQTKRIDMVLQVTGGESWMRVVVDNKNVFEGTLGSNNVKKFTGRDKIQVIFGNAGVVKVQVNGTDYGFLGGFGQVVTKTFTDKSEQQTTGG